MEAIRAGMQPGLTLVVGPPGTGKTDVAVQIISNLYHNFPNQRTLIVTHSNQALNQLFEKIMALDIDERHLLRLGHGEEALETEKDFSRYGRVNYVLAKRMDLLKEVQRLQVCKALDINLIFTHIVRWYVLQIPNSILYCHFFQESLEVLGDVAYTCETAGYFFTYQVMTRWERFESKVKQRSNGSESLPPEIVDEEFPFHKFFDNAPQPLFKRNDFKEDLAIAESCYR